MQVTIEAFTPDPVDVCSAAAGTCYGKADPSLKRLQRCFAHGHMSVFEHASVTFRIEGISRACSHQLVRHRVASYSQQSQRYCKMGPDYGTVMPPSVEEHGMDSAYEYCALVCLSAYRTMLNLGVPAEDARYVLLQGGETELVATMNLREFLHFLDLRTAKGAQWEIRDLAREMADQVRRIDGQYAQIVGMWEAKDATVPVE